MSQPQPIGDDFQPQSPPPPAPTGLQPACGGHRADRRRRVDPCRARLWAVAGPGPRSFLVRFAFIPLRYSGEYTLDNLCVGRTVHLRLPAWRLLAPGHQHDLACSLSARRSPIGSAPRASWPSGWPPALRPSGFTTSSTPSDPTPLVGASGAISGMMGAAARFAFRIDRSERRAAFTGPILSVAQVVYLAHHRQLPRHLDDHQTWPWGWDSAGRTWAPHFLGGPYRRVSSWASSPCACSTGLHAGNTGATRSEWQPLAIM